MPKPIGEKIKMRRNELGWSLRELAKRMDYSNHSTVARIESGKIDIPQSKVVKFAEVMGTSVAFLMDWDEKIEKDPVGTAERHFAILTDEDFVGMYDDFQILDEQERKIVKDLVRSLAKTKKTEV